MSLDQQAAARSGWRDLVADGRLPRFVLVCAGTWLTAADEMTTATIMPSVARDIGGYAWFGWAVAAFLLGSILGGATAGRLAVRLGLRPALAVAGASYAAGCAASALAPAIGWFLAGRMLQGLGGGAVVALCYVAVSSLFPEALWSRVFSALSGIWGAATLVSPLIGGLFAEAGFWRGAFWLFAVQGVAFVLAGVPLVPRGAAGGASPARGGPYPQVLALAVGVAGIGSAGLWPGRAQAAAAALLGVGSLILFLRLDARSAARLLPRAAADPRTPAGAGLAMMLCLQAATVAFSVYGAALLQSLHHARPILAGYILGVAAFAWTAAALGVAGRRPDVLFIRLGPGLIVAALAGLALAMPHGPLPLVAACVVLQGAGFGMAWSFTAARIVANTAEDERAFASASLPTAQLIGAAVGAAAAGAVANLLGFGQGITAARAAAAGFWLFAAFVPVAVVGWIAAWRLTLGRAPATAAA